MTLLGVSGDTIQESRAFAQRYGLDFLLLSDPDQAVAAQYAGVTSDGFALAGVTIIGRDGRVVFRHRGESKADRMNAGQVLAAIDRTLGTNGPVAVDSGFSTLARAQVRLEGGIGLARAEGDTVRTQIGRVEGLYPLGRHLLAGPSVGMDTATSLVDVNATALLRLPFWDDVAAYEIGASGGWSPRTDAAWNAGVRTGLSFAWTPDWSLQLGVTAMVHERDEASFVLTVGFGRLFRVR